jgi:hypothetical protein
MSGPLAITTYSEEWLVEQIQTASETTYIQNPLNLYERSHLYEDFTEEQKKLHIGNIHLNIP